MGEHPERVRRRIVPDEAQVQVIVGSLLGEARLVGARGARRMSVTLDATRADYVWWKYERLVQLAERAPLVAEGAAAFRTIAHPLFDDLAALSDAQLRRLLGPLGLAVWMADLGRLEVRAALFVPQRALAAAHALGALTHAA